MKIVCLLLLAKCASGISLQESDLQPVHFSQHQSGLPTTTKLFKHGYRVILSQISKVDRPIPTNVSWGEFANVSKIAHSAAYSIFTAIWRDRTVVLKSIRDKDMRSGSLVEMEKEISILSRVEHPNIIKLLGSGYSPFRFQILEHLGGGTLHKVLKDRAFYPPNSKSSVVKLLPQAKMFEYGIKFAEALHYMHEEFHPGIRLFHRDLKVQNIGLSNDGTFKVFDFGMAELIRKTVDENVLLRLGVAPANGKALGTWPYTAPEVLRRESYNHKSDVYCFAIILYYIMVGKHPMRHVKDHLEIKERVGVYDGWRPSPQLQWPDDLIHLFAEMWNDDVYVRPSMKEVADRLHQINIRYPNIFTAPLSGKGEIEFV